MIGRRQFMKAAAAGAAVARVGLRSATAAERLPFKLYDTHAHLISADTTRYPRAPTTNAAGAGPGGAPPQAVGNATPEIEKVLQWMAESGVGNITAVQRRGTYGFDNRYILDCADRFPKQLAPVVVLDAQAPETPAAIAKLVVDHAVAGVRFTGLTADDGTVPWLNSEAARRSWLVAEHFGLSVDIMSSPPGRSLPASSAYALLARQFPNARLVINHMGWPDTVGAPDFGVEPMIKNLRLFANVYFKFTSINIEQLEAKKISTTDMLRHAVDVYGADRMVWGSDVGNSDGAYNQLVTAMLKACEQLTLNEKRRLLHDTATRVYVRGGTRRT